MLIDKSKGVWLDNVSLIDDIAYSLYLKGYNKRYIESFEFYIFGPENEYNPLTQKEFKDTNDNFQLLDEYYEEANILIRREKIDKLKNK